MYLEIYENLRTIQQVKYESYVTMVLVQEDLNLMCVHEILRVLILQNNFISREVLIEVMYLKVSLM